MCCRHVAGMKEPVLRHGACDLKREAWKRHPSEDGTTAFVAKRLYTEPLHPNAIPIGRAMLQSCCPRCCFLLPSPTDPRDAAGWDSRQTLSQNGHGCHGLGRPIISGARRGFFPSYLPSSELGGKCLHSGRLWLPVSNPLRHFFYGFLHLLHSVALHLLHYL